MKFFDYMEKLEAIKYMAEHKHSATPSQLAEKFSVSERTVQRMVHHLRDHGYPIIFNRSRKCYEVNN